MTRRLLITGGAGFIGGNFVHYWAEAHPSDELVVLDALTYAGNRQTLAEPLARGQATLVHGDIADAAVVRALLMERAIDTVVHFAAESHVDRSIAAPSVFVRTNVLGTQVLLDACREAWWSAGQWRDGVRFHHVSTDEVYGDLAPNDPPFTEASPYAPSSPYAASKAAADHLVRAYARTFGLPASISNCSNNYGPFHFPEKLIPLMIVNALHGRALTLYGDGLQIRDWLYVEDHCRAIEAILERGHAGQTFNVGGRAEHTNLDIVHRLCAQLDARFADDAALRTRFPACPAARGVSCATLITHVADRRGHDRRYAIDPSALSATLGVDPRESLESGLARTVAWFLTHEVWWRGVMDGTYRAWVAEQYGVAE
jgi:dTDP-glucose 4,6-dehydratase